jgi:hypothetical protein
LIGVSLTRRTLTQKLFFVVIFGCGAVLATGLVNQANSVVANAVIIAVGIGHRALDVAGLLLDSSVGVRK